MTEAFDEAAREVMLAGIELVDRSTEEEGKRDRAKAYFAAWSTLLRMKPEALPAHLQAQLANLFDYLAKGIIPGPIADCGGPGNAVGPTEERDIRAAVVYVLAAERGIVDDKHYVKTVRLAYGASRNSVQGWVKARREQISVGELSDPEIIADRMKAAGARYSVAGRTHGANLKKASRAPR
jgi:hypothetical protein